MINFYINNYNILLTHLIIFILQSTSDFTIQVEGQSIHVHKVILKRRSQYFKDKFERDWTENDQK